MWLITTGLWYHVGQKRRILLDSLTFNPALVMLTFYQSVDQIVADIQEEGAQNLDLKFPETVDLSSCDERMQKLYRKIAQAVQKELKLFSQPEDSPFFVHYIFDSANDLLAHLDAKQPGGADFILRYFHINPLLL